MSIYHSFEELPIEILFEFFKYISLKELINLEKLNKNFLNLIRKTYWNHFIVKIQNIESIDFVINNYNFTKYDFSGSKITNDHVKLLGNCHTLNLSSCYNITDNSVQLLGNCHTLNLSRCNITDESVKLLGKY